jgi:(S)-beta-macrocarpene synthase
MMLKCRWEKNATTLLPEYSRDFYLYLLNTFYSFEEELGTGKSYRVFYLKKAVSIYVVYDC